MRNRNIYIFCMMLVVLLSEAQQEDDLLAKAKTLRFSNPDSAELLLDKAIAGLNKKNDTYRLSRAYNMYGTSEYAHGNVKRSDSLYRKALALAEQCKNDSVQIFVLNNIGQLYYDYGTYDESVVWYQKALERAQKAKLTYLEADTYNNLGSLNSFYKHGKKAIGYFNKGIEAYQRDRSNPAESEIGIADISNNIGDVYFSEGKYDLAVEAFFSALKMFEKHGEWSKAAIACNNVSEIYFDKSNYVKSKEYTRLALAYSEKQLNQYTKGNSLYDLGKIFEETDRLDSAEFYFKEAMTVFSDINQSTGLSTVYNSIASLYAKQGKTGLAKTFYAQAMEMNKSVGDTLGLCINYFNLADLAKRQGNYALAEEYSQAALKIVKPEMGYSTFVDLYSQASNIAGLRGKFEKAYEYITISNAYGDSLRNANLLKQQEELEAIYQNQKKEGQLQLAKAELVSSEEASKRKSTQLYAALAGALLLLVLIGFVVRTNIQRKRTNALLQEKNALISRQKEKVEVQHRELEEKNIEIGEKNKEILDSINYAQRIQYALLAHDELLKKNLPEHFVLFKPKDIVSGDFYWATEKILPAKTGREQRYFFFAVCDSTGHGVPGAFMSLLNISFLNEAINEKCIVEPNRVLDYVRGKLIENISQGSGGKDGMDGILLCIKEKEDRKYELSYAAAYNTPLLVRGSEVIALSADKMPVGKGERNEPFTLRTIEAQPGDVLYLYTDGYADQFGGDKGKKFKYKQLEELLISIHRQPMEGQAALLGSTIDKWRGNLEQVDDICVAGIRF